MHSIAFNIKRLCSSNPLEPRAFAVRSFSFLLDFVTFSRHSICGFGQSGFDWNVLDNQRWSLPCSHVCSIEFDEFVPTNALCAFERSLALSWYFCSFVRFSAEHSGEHSGNFGNVIVTAGATVTSANINNAFLRSGSSSYFDFANNINYEIGNFKNSRVADEIQTGASYDYNYGWNSYECAISVAAHPCSSLPPAPCDVPNACSANVVLSAPVVLQGNVCGGSTISVQVCKMRELDLFLR
jgi:hypothetical protein